MSERYLINKNIMQQFNIKYYISMYNICSYDIWYICWLQLGWHPVAVVIHLAVCLTTGPKPLPKQALHIVRSRAFSFKWEYPVLSLRSSSSFLRLLHRLPVTSNPPFIFPSITRCRRQFLRKMWPIHFAFRLRISCRIHLCSMT